MAITVLTDGAVTQDTRTLSWTIPNLSVGDVVSVAAITWDAGVTLNNPAGTGLSFGTPKVNAGSGSRTKVYEWAATASAGGTNVVVTCSVAAGGNSIHTGVCIVLPAADGYSLAATPNTASATPTGGSVGQVDLTGTANNIGIIAIGDWNGVNGSSRAWLMSATEDLYAFSSGNSTQYFAHCTLTGSTNTVGLSAPTTSTSFTVGAMEILKSAGGGGLTDALMMESTGAILLENDTALLL